jgi:hypothetical protein
LKDGGRAALFIYLTFADDSLLQEEGESRLRRAIAVVQGTQNLHRLPGRDDRANAGLLADLLATDRQVALFENRKALFPGPFVVGAPGIEPGTSRV